MMTFILSLIHLPFYFCIISFLLVLFAFHILLPGRVARVLFFFLHLDDTTLFPMTVQHDTTDFLIFSQTNIL